VNALPAERDRALVVTADGYEQLRSELETLCTTGRREMSERLREAREDGHLVNNPALYDLLEEQVRLERRIVILGGQLAAAEIGVPAADGAADIGSFVGVRDLQTDDLAEYELVGSIEPNVGSGRVSISARSDARWSVGAQVRSSRSRRLAGRSRSRSSPFDHRACER
jgi:transcription elongation factor GreA